MTPKQVVVQGLACRDTTLLVTRLPEAGGAARIISESQRVGGEGRNIHLVLQALEVPSVFLPAAVGQDDAGRFTRDRLELEGISIQLNPGAATPDPLIVTDGRGGSFILGRGRQSLPHSWPEPGLLAGAAWLVLDGGVDHRADRARQARAAGCLVALQDALDDQEACAEADLCCTSDHHAQGFALEDWRHPGALFITQGERGGRYVHLGRTGSWSAAAATLADATCAGDAFLAGLIAALMHTGDCQAAAEFAARVAAAACSCIGLEPGAFHGLRPKDHLGTDRCY